MAKQPESALQVRIQKLVEARCGYCKKNWGSMISEPGIADVTVCYHGLYITFECKVHDNKPTPAQGIHARKVQKAGGITTVVWSVQEAKEVLDIIDRVLSSPTHRTVGQTLVVIRQIINDHSIDDGTRY